MFSPFHSIHSFSEPDLSQYSLVSALMFSFRSDSDLDNKNSNNTPCMYLLICSLIKERIKDNLLNIQEVSTRTVWKDDFFASGRFGWFALP